MATDDKLEQRIAQDEVRLARDEQRLAFGEARIDAEEEAIRKNTIVARTGIALIVVLTIASLRSSSARSRYGATSMRSIAPLQTAACRPARCRTAP